ncbi:MAG: isoleucine--tRNA ligase [Pseudomonadaceae bacterium]|nr:isoleucine--tRNA ligase [Pseudomonadaceae bacterium]
MSEHADKRDFSATLKLPKTDFPMRAGLPKQEPVWVQRWLDEDVYGKLRAKRQEEGAATFILHLGPPYANGNFHMGHALTYVLKDLIVRSKFMAGFDSPYVPGWDCHGLPIEWKIEQELRAEKKTKHDVSVAELRGKCRAYAQKWIDVQKAEWQRLGAIGDWERPYKTMDKANEAGIVAELGKLVQRGMVYKGLRSTLWSWAEETALAEAEVEYADKESIAITLALPLVGKENEYVVIWTTTPWTLPANRAVAVKGDEDYVAVEHDGKRYWVAKALAGSFCESLNWIPAFAGMTRRGGDFVGLRAVHPLYDGVDGPLVEGFHVTTDSGTGLVHIAPSHGAEDFQIGVEQGLDLECPVRGDGTYVDGVEDRLAADSPLRGKLAGKLIWPAQKDILAELERKGWLLKQEKLVHSYPVSWRSKEKLIFRTTHQWFVDLDNTVVPETGKSVRESALDRIHARDGVKGVQWVPQYGENRIGSMIAGRPDWCISRQRAWGVPITIMVDKASGKVVDDAAVWSHIVALVAAEGIDAWDNRLGGRETELFPDGWLAAQGKAVDDFEYVRDILDVWFDSGTTHAHVLRADSGVGQRFHRDDGKRPADLYQEGSDQHRGWFHSSLLTSVAVYGDAPYEQVVTSGFVVDGEGRKFSKSLGNGVEPRQLWDKYGMDIVRLWVASSDYSEDIRYSPVIMDSMSDAYRRFRNTFRWLLGNLNGWDGEAVPYDQLPELEQYMLHRLGQVLGNVRKHFDAYQFHKAYRELYEFCGGDLSNFYFDVRKDVLYCDPLSSPARKGCLTVLDILLRALATHLAPILPFTCDEVWRSRMGDASVHMETFVPVGREWVKDEAFEARWDEIMLVRERMNQVAEKWRNEGKIKSNASAQGMVVAEKTNLSEKDGELLRLVTGLSFIHINMLTQTEEWWEEFEPPVHCVIRPYEEEVEIRPEENIELVAGDKCPRCWRIYGGKVINGDEPAGLRPSGVCARCDEALAEAGQQGAAA